MTDEKIYDLFEQREDKICKRVDDNIKTLTLFIAEENQEIRKSIDALTKKVETQNGSVRSLSEWRAGVQGREDGLKDFKRTRLTNWQLVGAVCGIVVGVIAILGFVRSIGNSMQADKLDYKLYWKEDRMPDSTVRSAQYPSITDDTAFIRRLEDSTRELLR